MADSDSTIYKVEARLNVFIFMCSAQIRNVGTSVCTMMVSVFAFIVLKSFPHLEELIGLPYCMTVFLCVACLGVVFVALCVPETNGKQLNVLDGAMAPTTTTPEQSPSAVQSSASPA